VKSGSKSWWKASGKVYEWFRKDTAIQSRNTLRFFRATLAGSDPIVKCVVRRKNLICSLLKVQMSPMYSVATQLRNLATACFLLFIVSGCATHIVTFQLEKVEVQKFPANSLEMPVMGPTEIDRLSKTDVFKVSFSSDENLMVMVSRDHLNVYNSTRLCSDQSGEMLSSFSGLLFDDQSVNLTNADSLNLIQKIDSVISPNRRVYSIYVWVSGNKKLEGNTTSKFYDLKRQPESICISIGGGAMGGPSMRSASEVVVSQALIVRALVNLR
jgi:hypothetical protein